MEYFNLHTSCGDIQRKTRKGEEISLPSPQIIQVHIQIKQMLTKYADAPRVKTHKSTRLSNDADTDRTLDNQMPISDLNQLLLYEAVEVMAAGRNVKQCHCCDAFFITDDNRKNYCTREYKDGKTCAEIGRDITEKSG